jgi:signal transduction histidine kinase/CheY-like chemotaxis protein
VEKAPTGAAEGSRVAVCLALSQAISRSRTVEEIYAIALDALQTSLHVSRASILLFDRHGVMRFRAFRGLSDAYREAVDGHSPWTPDSVDPQPIVVADVARDPSLAPYLPVIRAEGITAMAFIPLVSLGRVVGKFMLYASEPRDFTAEDLEMAGVVAGHVAFAVERSRAEDQARQNEERLMFALDAALMGTWDWDIRANRVRWSSNLERIHGLPPHTFDGSFASYEREIHPEDRPRVLRALKRAVNDGIPLDTEYRMVGHDGTIRWVEGKGRVEYVDGVPARMTGVCMVVTRRKEAENARLAASEESNRLKDEFLAVLSHELRTPLNAILGWVQILQTEGLGAERARQAIDVVGRNARMQARLIEDILDVSRIISGKLDIERQEVNLGPLIEGVVGSVQLSAEDKRIDLTSTIAENLPAIEGDPKRLQQVFANLLSNAVKFTPEGGRIEVRCAASGSGIDIAVADTGIGIAPDFLPHVFDRFRQADSRSTRRHGGLGLGLGIARHLLEQHGGEIRAESPGLARGTTVHVRLPVTQSTGTPSAAHADAAAEFDLPLNGHTVVVVDDERDSCEWLGVLLEQHGATVVRCDSGPAALVALAGGSVSLLVADIAMPAMDGYELIRQVRQSAAAVPAIAVSAYARSQDRDMALAAGYDGYCVKPIDAVSFLRTVRAVLRVA